MYACPVHVVAVIDIPVVYLGLLTSKYMTKKPYYIQDGYNYGP